MKRDLGLKQMKYLMVHEKSGISIAQIAKEKLKHRSESVQVCSILIYVQIVAEENQNQKKN